MYAMNFDDFKRKLAAHSDEKFPFKLELLETCVRNTPLWEGWLDKYMAEGSDINVTIEDDCNTYTFYKIVPRT